jgi:cytochrome c oxidase subunit 4
MSDSMHSPVVKPLTGAAAHDPGHGDDGHYDHDDALAHGGDDHSHGGMAKYWYVFIALCLLTSMSFFTNSDAWPFHAQPSIGRAFMMAISCCKALLVILFFMHVMYEANWKYVLTIPAGMMSIFLILMLVPDVGLRNNWAADERVNNMANKKDLNPNKAAHDTHTPAPNKPGQTPPATTTVPHK